MSTPDPSGYCEMNEGLHQWADMVGKYSCCYCGMGYEPYTKFADAIDVMVAAIQTGEDMAVPNAQALSAALDLLAYLGYPLFPPMPEFSD